MKVLEATTGHLSLEWEITAAAGAVELGAPECASWLAAASESLHAIEQSTKRTDVLAPESKRLRALSGRTKDPNCQTTGTALGRIAGGEA